MLPIRAVLESVGYNIGWNEGSRTVIISADGLLDGTWEGEEGIIHFYRNRFAFYEEGIYLYEGTFTVVGDIIEIVYSPEWTGTYSFSHLGDVITIDGVRYYRTSSAGTALVGTTQVASNQRTPLPLDSIWWNDFPDSILEIDSAGDIWVDGEQFTFSRGDDVVTPYQPSGEDVEPTWTAPSGNFHASSMRVGIYPVEWEDSQHRITPLSFYEAMLAHNSNMRIQGTLEQLATTEFVGQNPRGIAWNNGVVTVLLQRLQNPETGVWGRMSVEAWFMYERDPETGAISHSVIQIFYSDDTNAVWQLHAGGTEFGVEFAQQLWDALAMLDQAGTYADIEAARQMFG
jgi:hypothetical protein